MAEPGREDAGDFPPFRPFAAQVVSNQRLSPSFHRLVFTGPQLNHFGDGGLDQRVKLIFPHPDHDLPDLGQNDAWTPGPFAWLQKWRTLPSPDNFPVRTYTAATVDRKNHLVTIDFVVHPDGGPGSDFALNASPGTELIIAGPDARCQGKPFGVDFAPGQAEEILLIADETALPAVRSILQQTPPSTDVQAFIEVPRAEDARQMAPDLEATGHTVTVIARDEDATGSPRGQKLIAAALGWCEANPDSVRLGGESALASINIDAQQLWEPATAADSSFYAWIAGEAAVVRELRRILVQGRGVDKSKVSFMGYWREGRSLG